MGQSYLRKEGLKKLEDELENLKKVRMPVVIERISRAKELGDLSENAEYHDAKDEQGFIAGRINGIENLINQSEIITGKRSNDFVNIGSTIKVMCGSQEFEYTIVGSNEADPAQGLISNESPIGQAFLGAKKGEKVTVLTPSGEMECEVLAIS